MILISHIRFENYIQNRLKNHPFKMPGGTISSVMTIIFLLIVLIGMLFNKDTVTHCFNWYVI